MSEDIYVVAKKTLQENSFESSSLPTVKKVCVK